MRNKFAILASLLLVSACSSPPPPEPAKPVEQPKPKPPVPILPADTPSGPWIDWPLVAGDWVYRQDERGSIALFGVSGRDAKVTLRCDTGRKRLYLSVAGTVGSDAKLVMRSSSTTTQWPASPTGGTPNYAAAEIMPRDPGLDAIAYSRGRVALEVPGYIVQQVIPNWVEITRVIEDCRG